MTVYRLIIKGTMAEAKAACEARGIAWNDRRATPYTPTEVHAYVEAPHAVLSAWFCEAPHNAPFPPATLLHFAG